MDNGGSQHRVRPFALRDLILVQRLQRSGQVLDYERAGVDGVFPLRDALHACLPLSGAACQTLVLPGRNAFAQYAFAPESRRVHLGFVAPAPNSADHTDRWIDLLEQLVATVGAQGVQHIVAEARDDSPEFKVLQQLGFGVFTRQQLFRLARPEAPPGLGALPGLREWRSTDEWGLRLLYANTVPQLAQQIEAPADHAFFSSRWPHRLVLERDGEVIAGLVSRQGRTGSTLRLLLHPQADVHVVDLIQHGLLAVLAQSSRPIYCRVRRYESWLQAPLQGCGFELVVRTVLLVKHTVGRVMVPEWNRIPAVEGRAEVTSPVAQTRLQKSKS